MGYVLLKKGVFMKYLLILFMFLSVNLYSKDSTDNFNFLLYSHNPNIDLNIENYDLSNYHFIIGIKQFVINFAYIPIDIKYSDKTILKTNYAKLSFGYALNFTKNLYIPLTIGYSSKNEFYPDRVNFSLGAIYLIKPIVFGINYDNFTGIGLLIGLKFL